MHATLRIAHTWDGIAAESAEHAIVALQRTDAGLEIAIDAPSWGDPRPPAAPGPCDRLWEFEVVELFVAAAETEGAIRYTEVELGPHGHQLVLRFLGARNAVDRALLIEYTAARSGGRWQGRAFVPLELLPPEPWSANAFALHGQGAARRILAATPLPGPRPDFHQPERFLPLRTSGERT